MLSSQPEGEAQETMSDQNSLQTFINRCSWVWIIRKYYQFLYEREESVRLLNSFASGFFADIQSVLGYYLALQMCTLTDPAHTSVKGVLVENLTLNNLLGARRVNGVTRS